MFATLQWRDSLLDCGVHRESLQEAPAHLQFALTFHTCNSTLSTHHFLTSMQVYRDLFATEVMQSFQPPQYFDENAR